MTPKDQLKEKKFPTILIIFAVIAIAVIIYYVWTQLQADQIHKEKKKNPNLKDITPNTPPPTFH